MGGILLLALLIFGLPYVLIAMLWGRIGRLEDRLERTQDWANSLANSQAQTAKPEVFAPAPEPEASEPVE